MSLQTCDNSSTNLHHSARLSLGQHAALAGGRPISKLLPNDYRRNFVFWFVIPEPPCFSCVLRHHRSLNTLSMQTNWTGHTRGCSHYRGHIQPSRRFLRTVRVGRTHWTRSYHCKAPRHLLTVSQRSEHVVSNRHHKGQHTSEIGLVSSQGADKIHSQLTTRSKCSSAEVVGTSRFSTNITHDTVLRTSLSCALLAFGCDGTWRPSADLGFNDGTSATLLTTTAASCTLIPSTPVRHKAIPWTLVATRTDYDSRTKQRSRDRTCCTGTFRALLPGMECHLPRVAATRRASALELHHHTPASMMSSWTLQETELMHSTVLKLLTVAKLTVDRAVIDFAHSLLDGRRALHELLNRAWRGSRCDEWPGPERHHVEDVRERALGGFGHPLHTTHYTRSTQRRCSAELRCQGDVNHRGSYLAIHWTGLCVAALDLFGCITVPLTRRRLLNTSRSHHRATAAALCATGPVAPRRQLHNN